MINSPMPEASRALFRLGFEVIIWLSLPAGFLFLYVGRYELPAGAVFPHLCLVGLAFAAFALARIAFVSLVRAPYLQRIWAAALTATPLAAAVLYYALVLLGLEYWGRVTSWKLVATYAARAPELAETLGVSLPTAVVALTVALMAIVGAAWHHARYDWAPGIARYVPRRILWVAVPAGSLMVAVGFYTFHAVPPTHLFEPVSLTFFPANGKWKIHGYAIDAVSAARLDRFADAARASYMRATDAARKNVVLIVADALRPDHMGVYGYERDTTPALGKLDRDGLVRKASRVYAVCASSSCGLIGLASSRFVHEFHPRAISLHEVLQNHGYRVHLLLSGDHTNFSGRKLAYGAVDTYFDGSEARDRNMNDDRVLLERLAGFPDWDGTPVMFQFHLMSTHALGKRDAATSRFLPAANYAQPDGRHGGLGINFYDNGVAQADAIVSELLKTLAAKGYMRDTIVAITADHGECLGEHGLYLHANSVHEPALRIPFLLVSYGHAPGRAIDGHAIASQIDIAPTILAELGFPQPATWSGAPLQSPASRAFTHFQERSNIGLFDHREPENVWKYWFNSRTRREHAFNLSTDPLEKVNAVDRVPPERLREWRRRALIGAKVEEGPGA